MKRIGFFGGCFNPPNNVHIKIANDLIKENKLDEVVFIPVNDYYNKEKLVEAKHRYKMLKLSIQGYHNLKVDDIEIKEKRKLYAVDAFRVIRNSAYATKCLKRDIFMIMGSDNFNKMPKWKDYDIIKDEYNYIVIERNKNDISSTKIREMIKLKNDEVKKYLHEDVYKYIIENNLYSE